MKKLYFKKLRIGLLYALIMFMIYFIGANLLITLSNFFKNHAFIQMLIIAGIPSAILFFIATYYRKNNKDKMKSYNRSVPYEKLKLKDDIIYTLKSPDFRCELLSEMTLLGAYSLITCFKAVHSRGTVALPGVLLTSITITLAITALYAVADVTSWIVVHKHYLTDRSMVVLDSHTTDGTSK